MRKITGTKASIRHCLCICLTSLMLLCTPAGALAAEQGTIVLPSQLKTVEAQAFSGDSKMKKLVIPEGTLELKSGAFANCTAL